jgi:hypothetical protein
MKKVIAALGALALIVVLAGCGGSNPCADGCNKAKSCWQNFDCTKVDPAGQMACQLSKAAFSIDCSQIKSDQCTGTVKDEYEKYNTCTLDPTTCGCKQ